jgi:large subunit ribosomal protein L18
MLHRRKGIQDKIKGKNKKEAAKVVGYEAAARAKEKGIEAVVFDRSGYLYTGRVQSVADGAREAGLKF